MTTRSQSDRSIFSEICNMLHTLYMLFMTCMYFLAYSISIFPGKIIRKNEFLEIHTALTNFLLSIWIRFTKNYQYINYNQRALVKLSRKVHERKVQSNYARMKKKFYRIAESYELSDVVGLTSVSFIFLIQHFERKRQAENGRMARTFAPRSVIISRFIRARDRAFIHARFSLSSHRNRCVYVCMWGCVARVCVCV